MKYLYVLCVFMVLATLVYGKSSDNWELTCDRHGIKTYRCSQPGSKLQKLRGVAVVDARLENIAMVLRDVPNYPQWMDMCAQASILQKVDESNMTMHIVMKFPMIGYRDLVVKSNVVYNLEKARGLIGLRQEKNFPVPVYQNAMRMPEFSGEYQLEYLTPEKTGVIYTYHADPGGFVPAFAVNLVGKFMLYNTLKNLGTYAHKPQYDEAGEKAPERRLLESVMNDKGKVKSMVNARMLEYCRDADVIHALTTDQNVIDLLIKGDGSLLGQLFLTDGSREALAKALSGMLAVHARQYIQDNKKIEKIANDQILIAAVISGAKNGQPSALDRFNLLVADQACTVDPRKSSPN